jgi:lipopolysaccharide export system permease protein
VKLIDRYILSEYLRTFLYCLLGFCMLFVVWDLFDHMSKFLEARTHLRRVALYYLLVLVPTLQYLMPASLLMATLYTLWQFTRHNEITAMRASGVSLFRIMAPFLGVGFAMSVVTMGVQEGIAPPAFAWADNFAAHDFQETRPRVYHDFPYVNQAAHRQWRIDRFDLAEPHRLAGVMVTQERVDGTRARKFFAEKAEWLDGQWWFYGLQVQHYDAGDNPVGGLQPPAPDARSVTEMRLLNETPSDFINTARNWETLSSLGMLRYLRTHPGLSESTRAQRQYDLHSRLAMPWACLVVILFGLPAGARSGRHSALTGVFLAVGFFFAFYAVNQLGMFLGRRQFIEPWVGAWLPNVAFLAAGIYMMHRMR